MARYLVRLDYNVPLAHNSPTYITSTLRIDVTLPLLRQLLSQGHQVTIISHLGRPEGKDIAYSLNPIRIYLQDQLGCAVDFLEQWPDQKQQKTSIALAENLRFLTGETSQDQALVKAMCMDYDHVIIDAFAVAHRHHASTVGLIKYAPHVALGPLIQHEIEHIDRFRHAPSDRKWAIVGGSKVSTKLDLLKGLVNHVQGIMVGGAMANTLLMAQGVNMAKSYYEEAYISQAKDFIRYALDQGVDIQLPTDVVVASGNLMSVSSLGHADAAMDIGLETMKKWRTILDGASHILWAGPLGAFEDQRYAKASSMLTAYLIKHSGFVMIGGGDTLSSTNGFDLSSLAFTSTGGGAFLHYLAYGQLPVLEAMEQRDHA